MEDNESRKQTSLPGSKKPRFVIKKTGQRNQICNLQKLFQEKPPVSAGLHLRLSLHHSQGYH